MTTNNIEVNNEVEWVKRFEQMEDGTYYGSICIIKRTLPDGTTKITFQTNIRKDLSGT